MHPDFALRRLADRVRPREDELPAVRAHLIAIERRLAQAFPRSRIVQIGSHSRGTAIAVHSPIDMLAVLPRAWATWGGRRVPPEMIIRRIAEDLSDLVLTSTIRRDGYAVVLEFKGVNQAVQIVPGFFRRRLNHYPVYSIPNVDHRWMEASPEWHNAFFSQADMRSSGKLRVISILLKAWGLAGSPPLGISSLYVDMLLATSPIVAEGKSYGECLHYFLKEFVCREMRCLPDPANLSGGIAASPSYRSVERLYAAAKSASEHSQAAFDAQAHGKSAAAKRHWIALFRRRI
jgi:Second Messenger Oligonucleotide or Dinucleotide Synthetase domain